MNAPDEFENRLQRQPPRPVPPAWRDEILAAARRPAAATQDPRSDPYRGFPALARLRQQLTAVLWPHPSAWAGLAAAWVVILALYLSGRDAPTHRLTGTLATSAPQVRQLLREQERILAELIEPNDSAEIRPPVQGSPQPRSERPEQLLNS